MPQLNYISHIGPLSPVHNNYGFFSKTFNDTIYLFNADYLNETINIYSFDGNDLTLVVSLNDGRNCFSIDAFQFQNSQKIYVVTGTDTDFKIHYFNPSNSTLTEIETITTSAARGVWVNNDGVIYTSGLNENGTWTSKYSFNEILESTTLVAHAPYEQSIVDEIPFGLTMAPLSIIYDPLTDRVTQSLGYAKGVVWNGSLTSLVTINIGASANMYNATALTNFESNTNICVIRGVGFGSEIENPHRIYNLSNTIPGGDSNPYASFAEGGYTSSVYNNTTISDPSPIYIYSNQDKTVDNDLSNYAKAKSVDTNLGVFISDVVVEDPPEIVGIADTSGNMCSNGPYAFLSSLDGAYIYAYGTVDVGDEFEYDDEDVIESEEEVEEEGEPLVIQTDDLINAEPCGNSVVSIAFASKLNFYKGGVYITNNSLITEAEQSRIASQVKEEFSNWVVVGANTYNTTSCSLHMEVTPTQDNTIILSFYTDGTAAGIKVAEGIATAGTTMVATSFNNSGINISTIWSGTLPRSDIQRAYFQIKIGTINPEARTSELQNVKTIVVTETDNIDGTNSSDHKGTLDTIFSRALSFGNLAPGQTSDTLIVYLNVPNAIGITNIRLGLIDKGGIELNTDTFGVYSKPVIDRNFVPSNYFSDINSTNQSTDENNVDIGNRDLYSSEFVYLNITLPNDQDLGTGVIRYKWFFDYQ